MFFKKKINNALYSQENYLSTSQKHFITKTMGDINHRQKAFKIKDMFLFKNMFAFNIKRLEKCLC